MDQGGANIHRINDLLPLKPPLETKVLKFRIKLAHMIGLSFLSTA